MAQIDPVAASLDYSYLCESYLQCNEIINSTNARKLQIKNTIKTILDKRGVDTIIEDGYKSSIGSTTKSSLDEDKLIAKFGASALADCYVRETSERFSCRRA